MTEPAPKHPGKILFEQVMTPLGVSRNKLARDIDVPVGRISDIVAGKRGVTPDTALRFARYFGTTAELWLRLQADYDLHVVRSTTWPDAEHKVSVFEGAADRNVQTTPADASDQEISAPPSVAAGVSEETADIGDVVSSESRDAVDISDDIDNIATDASDNDDIDIPEPVGLGAARGDAS